MKAVKMMRALQLERTDLVFSTDEKRNLQELIKHLLELADDARFLGIIGLDVVLQDEPDPFIQYLYQKFADGVDPERVEQMLEQLFLTLNASTIEKFRLILTTTAAFSVHRGDGPWISRELLTSWLGMHALIESATTLSDLPLGTYRRFSLSLKGRRDMSETALQVSETLLQQDGEQRQSWLNTVTLEEVQVLLRFCRTEVLTKVAELLAMRFRLGVVKAMVAPIQSPPSPEEEVVLQQLLARMESAG